MIIEIAIGVVLGVPALVVLYFLLTKAFELLLALAMPMEGPKSEPAPRPSAMKILGVGAIACFACLVLILVVLPLFEALL